MISHVLDTSAVLAHYLNEPGAGDVHSLIARYDTIGFCVISLPELKTRLREILGDPGEVERVFALYADTLTTSLSVTREMADMAIQLRETTRPRLPTVDAVIAACAQIHQATLVHRDPHLTAIPTDKLQQLVLPSKNRPGP